MRRLTRRSSRVVPWVHAAVCRPMLAYLEHLGVPFDSYLEKHGLPLHEWRENEDILPRHAFGRFLIDVARSQGIENFCWATVAHARSTPRPFAMALPPRLTLLTALKDSVARTRRLSSIDIHLVDAPDSLLVCRRPNFGREEGHDREMGWFAVATFLSLVRDYAGDDWSPPRMAVLSSPAPGNGVASEFPATRILDAQGSWWLEIPRPLLRLPAQRAARGAASPGDLPPEALTTQSNLPRVLGKIVQAYLPSGAPTLQSAAEAIGTSPRSLQRRLGEAGRTFSEVLEESRFQLARKLLDSTAMSVRDVAHEAGYDSASNFTRAFHRYTGVTPRAHRRLRLATD